MARPPLDIDPEQVAKLAALHCTTKEIADFFECSPDTIERRFAAELTKGRSTGKIKLRRLQWQIAEGKHAVMCIFLGKQYLGQKDKSEEEIDAISKGLARAYTKEEIIEMIKAARGSK